MKQSPWTPEFEGMLRERLPFLAPDAALAPDRSLFDLGLDSINAVSLVVAIEDGLGVTVEDELLDAQIFSTASYLWSVVSRLQAGGNDARWS